MVERAAREPHPSALTRALQIMVHGDFAMTYAAIHQATEGRISRERLNMIGLAITPDKYNAKTGQFVAEVYRDQMAARGWPQEPLHALENEIATMRTYHNVSVPFLARLDRLCDRHDITDRKLASAANLTISGIAAGKRRLNRFPNSKFPHSVLVGLVRLSDDQCPSLKKEDILDLAQTQIIHGPYTRKMAARQEQAIAYVKDAMSR